jgi:serine/threonine protein kinase
MPLVNGSALNIEADARRLGFAARLALMRAVAESVAAAHAAGIVHRDLKPGNILVEERDGALVPRLIDFGIARALAGDQARLTPNDHAHRLGTPDYMSPEQWQDGVGACDARSDVFALGVVLGELMSGVLPREGGQRHSSRDRKARAPAAVVAPSAAIASLAARDPRSALAAAELRGFNAVDSLVDALRRQIDATAVRATATLPTDRFSTAAGLLQNLGAA